jgi:hypothetical protein
MDFGWNESALRMDPRCDLGGTKVKYRWNLNEIKLKTRWGYKYKQYYFTRIIVSNQAW